MFVCNVDQGAFCLEFGVVDFSIGTLAGQIYFSVMLANEARPSIIVDNFYDPLLAHNTDLQFGRAKVLVQGRLAFLGSGPPVLKKRSDNSASADARNLLACCRTDSSPARSWAVNRANADLPDP
jgi:hypothetical protein